MTFEQWKNLVNQRLIQFIGMSCDDIPDWGYWDAWDSGSTPHEATIDIMEENGLLEQAGWDDGISEEEWHNS